MAKRYANLDTFTKSFPGPRGGSVCFTPGEAREGHWWARFANGGGLQEVGPEYNPSRDFKGFHHKAQPVVSPRIIGESTRVTTGCTSRCDSACQIACETKCELACETSKQAIAVTEKYEKVGVDYYCRRCDWSTQDPKRVDEHIEAYHPDLVPRGPVEGANSESWSDPQKAMDPGSGATTPESGDRAVPTRSSPPPGTPPGAEAVEGNGYWEMLDGLFHCLKCQQEMGVKWTTTARGAMARHAKKHHGYVTEPDVRKKAVQV
jgi:hypothetical protein